MYTLESQIKIAFFYLISTLPVQYLQCIINGFAWAETQE